MDAESFRRELLSTGWLKEGGVDGLYARSFEFERIARGVEAYVSAAGDGQSSERFYFSSVIAASTLEASGYLKSFPDLIGSVATFRGGEKDHRELLERADAGGEWTQMLSASNLALCSASCHPLYPLLVGRSVSESGLHFEVQGQCFRHEPSQDPGRMQSFRQHEFVYVGTDVAALLHRDTWLERGHELLGALGLNVQIVEANDPFFGRAGRLLAAGQRDKALKYELVAPISSETPGAIASANYHEDHFGESFGIFDVAGVAVHSACIGFGLERISLSLLWHHGLRLSDWPLDVRTLLKMDRPAGENQSA